MSSNALRLRTLVALSFVAALAAPANAYLGSFEINDGYNVQSSFIGGDVSYYNAGAHGPNAGGGALTHLAPNAGLWDVISQPGGYFANAADRTLNTSTAPPYPVSPTNAIGAYIVGNHGGGHAPSATCLAIRNDTPAGTGSMVYDYELDSFDFGGVAPASISTGVIPIQWWFCPNPGDSNNSGSKIGEKFSLTFRDNLGNVGFQWGYDRANGVTWRTSSSNPWNATTIVADQTNWDSVKVNLDLSADTFSIDYFDISANTWSNMVPAGTALGMAMSNLTFLQWELVDDLSAGQGGKNFFDDFSFFQQVPEPSSLALAGLAVACLARRRRS
jgi:hypothetical protein